MITVLLSLAFFMLSNRSKKCVLSNLKTVKNSVFRVFSCFLVFGHDKRHFMPEMGLDGGLALKTSFFVRPKTKINLYKKVPLVLRSWWKTGPKTPPVSRKTEKHDFLQSEWEISPYSDVRKSIFQQRGGQFRFLRARKSANIVFFRVFQ